MYSLNLKKNYVTEVFQSGYFETVRIERRQYNRIMLDFKRDYDIQLPSYTKLKNMFGDPEQLRILTKFLKVTICLKNGDRLVYKFFPGFIWDLASVPKAFRSVIDNDSILMLCPSLVHDTNRSIARFSIRTTDQLFYQMVLQIGKYANPLTVRLKARIAYLAVSSIIGRTIYRKRARDRASWIIRFNKFKFKKWGEY